jgi:glycosyltransferase involved in cell wall biosynthesis
LKTASTDPTVSVVVPAYNAEAFIQKTLDSVRAQMYLDYEIIVVDDGSSDSTQAVVEAWFKRHGIPGRGIRQENKKIAGARNTGMRAAQGRFIALLDHDDLWYPEKLTAVMNEFSLHPDVDLICHNENITREGKILRATQNGPDSPHMYEKLLFGGNALSPSASVFKKEKAMAIGGFRENPEFNTVEDYDFWMRLSRIGSFHFIDRVLGEYQLVERAASRRIEYHHSNMEAMLQDHFALYVREHPGWYTRLRIRRRLATVYRSALGQLMGYGEYPEQQRAYLLKMLRTFPLDPKNLMRAAQWAIKHRKD